MSKSFEKLEAISLRQRGFSIKDISKVLKVSRSSVSVWCQNVPLSQDQKDILLAKQIAAGNVGRQKGAEVNRQKRIRALAEAAAFAEEHVKNITPEHLFYIGLGLYWGEGIKSRSGPAAVVNSDPRVLRTAKRWFVECLGVAPHDIRPYVYISSEHRVRQKIIMEFWLKELNIPVQQFKSPIFIKHKSKQKYDNSDSYYGVVALRILRSTNLKYRIIALIKETARRLE